MKIYSATCPGSLMIAGEHAVLHGSSAIVAAINKTLTVKLSLSKSKDSINNINIVTDINKYNYLAERNLYYYDFITDGKRNIESAKYFEYITAVINYFSKDLAKSKLDYNFVIESSIDSSLGLGSSGAVTVATVSVILDFLSDNKSHSCLSEPSGLKDSILSIAHKIILSVQGNGSGADLVASIYGGVCYYTPLLNNDGFYKYKVEKINNNLPIIVVYSGYKLSTKEVINKINTNSLDSIYQQIADNVELAKDLIIQNKFEKLGLITDDLYSLQKDMGVSDDTLHSLVSQLNTCGSIYGAKISGSGLGDCVIGLGALDNITKQSIDGLIDVSIESVGLVVKNYYYE